MTVGPIKESERTVVDQETGPGPKARRSVGSGFSWMHALEAYGLLLLMLGCIVFFSIWPTTSATFLTEANIRILLAN